MKIVEVWETDDGQVFKSITEARVHEKCQEVMPEIEAFFKSGACKYNSKQQVTIIKSAILSWILWQAKGGSK